MGSKIMASNSSSLPGGGPAADPGSPEIEGMNISEIIEFLKSSFQKKDYERVERVLVSQEKSIKVEMEMKFSEEMMLKEVEKCEFQARIDGLQRDFGVLRNRYSDLEHRICKEEAQFDIERTELERKVIEEKEMNTLLAARVKELENGKVTLHGEIEEHKRSHEKIQERIAKLEEDCRVLSEREQKYQEKIASLVEFQKQQGNITVWMKKCQDLEPSVRQLEDASMREIGSLNQGNCVLPEHATDLTKKKHTHLNDKGNQVVQGVIEISDSEEVNIVQDSHFKIQSKEDASDKHWGLITEKEMQIAHSVNTLNQTKLDEECFNNAENLLSVPTPKRKRLYRVITSDSENDADNYDIPISKLKYKRIKDVVEEYEEADDLFKEVTHSRRRLINSEESYGARDKTKGKHAKVPVTPSTRSTVTKGKARTCRKLDYVGSEDEEVDGRYKGKEVNDSGSEYEGDNLGGFIVSESDNEETTSSSSTCADSSSSEELESDVDLNNVLANIRREKDNKHWEYEADMLSSFSKDPKLCLKAVCALYRRQTSEEKSVKGALFVNKRGFNKFDAEKGSMIAEFLLDGDIHGPLRKSVEELEKFHWNGLDYCHELANRYSKQLFTIYQNEEDPFFLP